MTENALNKPDYNRFSPDCPRVANKKCFKSNPKFKFGSRIDQCKEPSNLQKDALRNESQIKSGFRFSKYRLTRLIGKGSYGTIKNGHNELKRTTQTTIQYS